LARVSAKGDADRIARADADTDPEMVDVCSDGIQFRSEGGGRPGDMDEIAMVQTVEMTRTGLAAAMGQGLRERWRRPNVRPLVRVDRRAFRHVLPARETNHTEESDRERGEMITRQWAQQPRSRAEKLVGETKEAVTDQVEMKMLAREKFLTPKKKEECERDDIEAKFGGDCRPPRYAVRVLNCVRAGRTSGAQTATVEQTADAPESDADRGDEREVVAGGALVAQMAFRQLDENITAEERAENGLTGGKLWPHVGRAKVEPAFGEQVNDFRAEESADQRRAINENQAFVLPRASFPKEEANDDAGEEEPGVR
jgi:hypothetical protein